MQEKCLEESQDIDAIAGEGELTMVDMVSISKRGEP
jgi:hypothetical protein